MANNEFELGGVCHLALVCSDMERTLDFYTNTLGMKLAKTIALPNGAQHFFFDMGDESYIAFFWFPGAPPAAPGIASPAVVPGLGGDIRTAHASMNHVSFKIPVDKFEEYREKLIAKGVVTGPILYHDDSERGMATEMHDGVYVKSMYFFDPDRILLEFAAWTRALRPEDVAHQPVNAEGKVSAATA